MWIWEAGPPSLFPSLWSPSTRPARLSRHLISPHFLFPTPLRPPPCDLVSHPAVPLVSLRSANTDVGAGDRPRILCLGTARPPRSDGNAPVGGSLKRRPRINQFDDVGAQWLTEWSQPCTCTLALQSCTRTEVEGHTLDLLEVTVIRLHRDDWTWLREAEAGLRQGLAVIRYARPSVVTVRGLPLAHVQRQLAPPNKPGLQEASSAGDIHCVPRQICVKSSIQSPAVPTKPPDWKADAEWRPAR